MAGMLASMAAQGGPNGPLHHSNNRDMNALRSYVTANDHQEYSLLPPGVVSVLCSHSDLKMQMMELKLELKSSILQVKEKLRSNCGTSPEFMELILKANTGHVRMDDNSKMLGFYGVESGMEIHIIDHNPCSLSKGGWLENTDLVKKYEMTEEEYNSRKNTVRQYKKDQLAKDPNWVPVTQRKKDPPPGPESVVGWKVGDRCQQVGDKRGTIMFIGEIVGLPDGHWVGVKLDEPTGKNDGSTPDGTRLFTCPKGYGTFLRPTAITVGDFPEKSIFDELGEDSDEDEL